MARGDSKPGVFEPDAFRITRTAHRPLAAVAAAKQ
jgi:hypothetical protein